MSGDPIDDIPGRLSAASPTIAIVGLGYVGLPLAVALGASGAQVEGIDTDAERVSALREGRSHVGDVPSEALAPLVAGARPRFRPSTDFTAITGADAVVICVPTPLRKTKDPDMSHVLSASRAVAAHGRPGQLVVLESTTYPGTTEEILVPMLRERGLEPGRDVAVAFSPERVDPGNKTWTLRNTPKVVGGYTARCAAVARALYERTCDRVVMVSSPAAAEMVKLLENTFRSVNIGLVNEFALTCRRLGLDVWEIAEAAATKPFGFMSFKPGPGLGGHCIPVDPLYLAWKLRSLNFTVRFVELADAINAAMPAHVVGVLADALNDRQRSVRGARVLVLGVTYKRDVADVRESPALEILSLLVQKGADVTFHDPFVPHLEIGTWARARTELSDEALRGADAVLLVTDHACYDATRIVRESRLVVDTRNATGRVLAEEPAVRQRVYRT